MRIYLSLPSYDQRYWGHTMMSVLASGAFAVDGEVFPDPISGSVLPRVFNEALGRAVTRGYDRLVMLHADIAAEPGWLPKLLTIQDEYDCDILSSVVAIKDDRTLTSTGIHTPTEQFRKLSLHECHNCCAQTFSVNDPYLQQEQASTLLVNTGLLVMRLDRPWLWKWHGFQFRTGIVWGPEQGGTHSAHVHTCSEDWDMSEQLSALDCKIMATSAIRTHHFGNAIYPSHLNQATDAIATNIGGSVSATT
jgi:hypothetical protein